MASTGKACAWVILRYCRRAGLCWAPRMKLKTGVLIGPSLLLTLVATAQWTAETAKTERRPHNAGYEPGVAKHIGRLGDHAAVSPPSTFSPSSEENAAEPEISESTAPG